MAKKHESEKELKQKIADLEDSRKRIAAEFENFKKRIEAQSAAAIEFAIANFIAEVTPVLDNFTRAFLHAPKNEFADGMKQIEKQLEAILIAKGLKRIDVKPDDPFDHNLHEAISGEPNDEIPDNHIIAETESGWKFGNRVIKPAKVRVSKRE